MATAPVEHRPTAVGHEAPSVGLPDVAHAVAPVPTIELSAAPSQMSSFVMSPGDKLGRFEIEKLIGRGGMGAVYQARDTKLERRVAVKTLSPAVDQSADALVRFEREAQAVSGISHPNVVEIFDFGFDHHRPYIVMELLQGQDLASLLAKGPLAPARAIEILLGVCAGVQAAHDRQIVHRDLKPHNIMLTRTPLGEVPKVLDFGVSKRPDAQPLTATSGIVGTTAYMSPEQASGGHLLGPPSDQYALGVVLYECVTGRLPYAVDNIYLLLRAVVEGSFVRPSQLRPDLPPRLETIILKMMGRAPADRFADLRAVGKELLPFASERVQMAWHDYFTHGAPAPTHATGVAPSGPQASTQALPDHMAAHLPVTLTKQGARERLSASGAALPAESTFRSGISVTGRPRGSSRFGVRGIALAAVGVVAVIAIALLARGGKTTAVPPVVVAPVAPAPAPVPVPAPAVVSAIPAAAKPADNADSSATKPRNKKTRRSDKGPKLTPNGVPIL